MRPTDIEILDLFRELYLAAKQQGSIRERFALAEPEVLSRRLQKVEDAIDSNLDLLQ